MAFCKAFNAKTAGMEAGHADPGHHHLLHRQVVQPWRSRRRRRRSCLKKAAGLTSRQAKAPRSASRARVAGSVTLAQVREIAEAKMKDLNANDVEAAMQIIVGSARSMGIEVKG